MRVKELQDELDVITERKVKVKQKLKLVEEKLQKEQRVKIRNQHIGHLKRVERQLKRLDIRYTEIVKELIYAQELVKELEQCNEELVELIDKYGVDDDQVLAKVEYVNSLQEKVNIYLPSQS